MKKFLLTAMALCSLWATAQTDSTPEYFPQGTVWTAYETDVLMIPDKNQYKVDGVEQIDGKEYKVIRMFNEPVYVQEKAEVVGHIRQEGRKVYRHASDEYMALSYEEYMEKTGNDYLLYDFGLQEGQQFGLVSSNTVSKVSAVTTSDGVTRKVVEINGMVMVEGIGAVETPFFMPVGPIPTSGNPESLNVFNEPDGQTIYTSKHPEKSDLMRHSGFTFVKEGVKWVERTAKMQDGQPAADFTLVNYAIGEEEKAGDKTYRKVMRDGKQVTSLRQDADGTVYYLTDGQERVLYYFDWNRKDRLQYHNGNEQKQLKLLTENAMFLRDGYGYPYMRVENPSAFHTYTAEDVRLIQGIGLTTGLLSHIGIGGEANSYNDLLAVYDGEQTVYRNPQFKQDGSYTGFKTGMLVQEGRRWAVLETTTANDAKSTCTTVLKGDTLLAGKTYKKVYETYRDKLEGLSLKGCVRQEDAMVYYIPARKTEEQLLFNFDSEHGTTFGDPHAYPYVESVTWMEDNGLCLPAFNLSGGAVKNDTHVAGIGSLYGGLFPHYAETDGKKFLLLCCHQNDRLIYQDKNYSECYFGDTSIGAGQEVRKPYSYADNCFSFDTTSGEISFAIYDTNGSKLYTASSVQPTLHVGFLPMGIYLCRVETAGYTHWERFAVAH